MLQLVEQCCNYREGRRQITPAYVLEIDVDPSTEEQLDGPAALELGEALVKASKLILRADREALEIFTGEDRPAFVSAKRRDAGSIDKGAA